MCQMPRHMWLQSEKRSWLLRLTGPAGRLLSLPGPSQCAGLLRPAPIADPRIGRAGRCLYACWKGLCGSLRVQFADWRSLHIRHICHSRWVDSFELAKNSNNQMSMLKRMRLYCIPRVMGVDGVEGQVIIGCESRYTICRQLYRHAGTAITLAVWLCWQVLRPRKAGEKSETVRLEVKLLNGADLLLELVGTPAWGLLHIEAAIAHRPWPWQVEGEPPTVMEHCLGVWHALEAMQRDARAHALESLSIVTLLQAPRLGAALAASAPIDRP